MWYRTMSILRRAKNGCVEDITFFGKFVYHQSDFCPEYTMKDLGKQLNKKDWIKKHLTDFSKKYEVEALLVDWHLYENGWFVSQYTNKHLFYYKCQYGNSGLNKPEILEFLSK